MIGNIIRTQILENIYGIKFVVTFIVCTLLVVAATITGIGRYEAQLSEEQKILSINKGNLEESGDWHSVSRTGIKVIKPSTSLSIFSSGLEESVGEQLLGWPEVVEVDGALIGNVQAEDSPYFYIYGYDPEGFAIKHFRIIEGQALNEARRVRGKPLLLGQAAADSMSKEVGDTLHITNPFDGIMLLDGAFAARTN